MNSTIYQEAYTYFYVVNIVFQIFFTAFLWYLIGLMKYRICYALLAWKWKKNYEPMGWIWERKHYFFTYLLGWIIPLNCIINASQLDIGLPHFRPIISVIIAICIWTAFIIHTYLLYRHNRKLEDKVEDLLYDLKHLD